MDLVLFDLDHTLLNGDTEIEWGRYLIERGLLEPKEYYATLAHFNQGYRQGKLDIYGLLQFQLKFLTRYPFETLYAWREEYIEKHIRPLIVEAGWRALAKHRSEGAEIILITATHEFLTTPIAKLLGIKHLIASRAERDAQGNYTGNTLGTPSYREGKVIRFQEWLDEQDHDRNDYKEILFYSDSHNDLPLLSIVTHPIAVNPDEQLLQHALQQHWQIADFGVERK